MYMYSITDEIFNEIEILILKKCHSPIHEL